MTTHKKKTTTKKIDENQFVDKETGETLGSAHPGIRSVNTVDEDVVIMHSKEFVVIDSVAFQYISKNFSVTDIGRILKMADMTYGEYNILYNGNVPHDKSSLMEAMEYSRNKFAAFMKLLERKSIIYYISGYFNDKPAKYIMLNPHLARKRKTINRECFDAFQDIKQIEG
jgi:uncharacterized protein YeeX (DUF496 family)